MRFSLQTASLRQLVLLSFFLASIPVAVLLWQSHRALSGVSQNAVAEAEACARFVVVVLASATTWGGGGFIPTKAPDPIDCPLDGAATCLVETREALFFFVFDHLAKTAFSYASADELNGNSIGVFIACRPSFLQLPTSSLFG